MDRLRSGSYRFPISFSAANLGRRCVASGRTQLIPFEWRRLEQNGRHCTRFNATRPTATLHLINHSAPDGNCCCCCCCSGCLGAVAGSRRAAARIAAPALGPAEPRLGADRVRSQFAIRNRKPTADSRRSRASLMSSDLLQAAAHLHGRKR